MRKVNNKFYLYFPLYLRKKKTKKKLKKIIKKIGISSVYQELLLEQTTPEALLVTGWSYKEPPSSVFSISPDYSIYVDVQLMNGTFLYGRVAEFSDGPRHNGWQYATHVIE